MVQQSVLLLLIQQWSEDTILMLYGKHIYIGEELAYLRETDNEHDRYAVSIVKSKSS